MDGVKCFFSSRRRHTISLRDWSSDVCTSDLPPSRASRRDRSRREVLRYQTTDRGCAPAARRPRLSAARRPRARERSEERRVGKEWRCRWSLDQLKKNDVGNIDGETSINGSKQ